MRHFNYGSTYGSVPRPIFPVRRGGNKLGVLEEQVGFPNLGILRDIDSIETKIKQGTWGKVPGGDPVAGKAAGLLCVSTRGSGAYTTTTLWYQIGVDSNGETFAELGWQIGASKGTMLKTYKHTITDDTVLKMVPNGKTVEFHFGSNVEELTWNQNPSDWIGSGAPNFDWDDTNKIAWIRQQIEAFWGKSVSSASSIELPGTRGNPFVFGPTKYKEKLKADAKTISGNDFSLTLTGNDSNFRRSSKGDKVKLWSSKNSESKEQN